MIVLASRIRYLKESTVCQGDQQERQELARHNIITKATTTTPTPTAVPAISPSLSNTSGISMASSVSSLSAPSVVGRHVEELAQAWSADSNHHHHHEEEEEHWLKSVPSTDPEVDLRTNVWELLLRNYGVRLFGVSVSWLLWDGTCII